MAKTIRQQVADLDEQIKKLTAKRDELNAKADSEVDYDKVQAGAVVTFTYGKGETKRELTGQVLGRKNAEPGTKGGDLIRIAVGEGFDAQIVTTYPACVTKIHADEVPAEEAAPAA
jgi:hypothetical protein